MKSGSIFLFFLIILTSHASAASKCSDTDLACKEFETLAGKEQFAQLISRVEPQKTYSQAAQYYIGKSYLALASLDGTSEEQEEAFCRKAVEFGENLGYMCLYFAHYKKNRETALAFLRDYVAKKPVDSVPYVILGEAELDRKNYKLADTYLRQSRLVAQTDSPSVAWMLFQANYLLGNYPFAEEMLKKALGSGQFEKEMNALIADTRFAGLEKRPEFQKILQERKQPTREIKPVQDGRS